MTRLDESTRGIITVSIATEAAKRFGLSTEQEFDLLDIITCCFHIWDGTPHAHGPADAKCDDLLSWRRRAAGLPFATYKQT